MKRDLLGEIAENVEDLAAGHHEHSAVRLHGIKTVNQPVDPQPTASCSATFS